jgi:hypothetical protein
MCTPVSPEIGLVYTKKCGSKFRPCSCAASFAFAETYLYLPWFPLRVYYGSTMGLQWVYYGSTMGLQWVYYESTMGPLWVYFGSPWVHCWSTMGLLWARHLSGSLHADHGSLHADHCGDKKGTLPCAGLRLLGQSGGCTLESTVRAPPQVLFTVSNTQPRLFFSRK